MYNYNELQAVELSPTKKDYYQIWNELIDVAGKLSSRWDPSATNESDPGIVLLKVLTAIADKLNYNIDANTLEAFMPSAAQESSMRKLCEMLGYNMQYYKSATTTLRITYNGMFPTINNGRIVIDRFTNIKDKNSTYNYVTLQEVSLEPGTKSATVECIEGELVTCQTENGNTITLIHLDDNNRFYLPEQQVASNDNCVFISTIDSPEDFWSSTDNLNTCSLGSKVYRFGYDSSRALPYVQFPDDVGALIGSGLTIKFLRTRGASGNIATHFLQTMEKPSSWAQSSTQESSEISASEVVEESATLDNSWTKLENYSITNIAPARNGRDPETIDEAYWNYQKTIGTFDTLVTCRDYMNKIYQMTLTETDTTPLVSNIIVSDIRDDINRAYTVCTYTDQGIEYNRYAHKESEVVGQAAEESEDRIKYFDLVLYPFETVYGLNTKQEFENSFKYSSSNGPIDIIDKIEGVLEANKTIAHRFITPDAEDIVCIKVYFQLSARLTTTSKVSDLEALEIELSAHTALYKKFNLRNISFGDELPYDEILKALTFADPRIKNVILEDPKMILKVCLKDGTEIPISSDNNNYVYTDQASARRALEMYKQLVLMNVLAGKIPLFNYNSDFSTNYEDLAYPEGNASLDTSMSLRLDSETTANPGEITLKSTDASNEENKTPAFIKPDSGTLFLKLDYNSTTAPDLEKAFSLITAITVNVFTKGASTPAYKYTIKPTSSRTAIVSELTDSEGQLIDPKNNYRYFNYLVGDTAVPFENILQHSLCQIPFNLTSNSDTCPVFDKVTVTTELNTATAATAEATAAVEALTLKFTWKEPVTGTCEEGATHTLENNDDLVLSAGATDIDVSLEFSDFEQFTASGYWPGATIDDPAALKLQYNIDAATNTPKLQVSYTNNINGDGVSLETGTDSFSLSAFGIQTLKIKNIGGQTGTVTVRTITSKEAPVHYAAFFDPNNSESFVQLDSATNTLNTVNNNGTLTPTSLATKLEVKTDSLSSSNPLVLTDGEVIQFRSPNFKTVATYPAYVNYFAKLDASRATNNETGSSAIPATMITLHEFFGGGKEQENIPTPEDEKYYIYLPLDSNKNPVNGSTNVEINPSVTRWSRRFSWEEKVNSLPAGLLVEKYITKESFADSAEEEAARHAYNSLVSTYKAVFVKDTDNKYRLFELPNATTDASTQHLLGIPTGITFYVLNITAANLLVFVDWLRGKNKQITYRAPNGDEINRDKCITSIYSQGSSNLARRPGKLVDSSSFKYTELNSINATPDKVLINCYVPQVYKDNDPGVVAGRYTKDGLGRDATALGIPANTEYMLKDNEYILLTYSSSEGREDGISVVKNIALCAGTVIKTNFSLLDSAEKAMLNKYSKTSNFGPWQLQTGEVIQPSSIMGMFTFGADEQLEVREPISFEIDGQRSNLYWEVRQPRIIEEFEYFPFDENTGSYILQSGEYLFYTDSAMESMAYYGAGTEIKRNANTPELRVTRADRKISAELANEVGLVASMPWKEFNLSDTKSITITEYKLINLAPGDVLTSIAWPEESTDTVIDESFKPVQAATYNISGAEGELPALVLDGVSWEVRSKLELALGPEHPQKLNVHRTTDGLEIARNFIMLSAEDGTNVQVFTPQARPEDEELKPVPMFIYCSTPILGADGKYFFSKDSNGRLKEALPTFKICAQADTVGLAFDNNSFARCDLSTEPTKLNIVVPDNCFSLATFYVPYSDNLPSNQSSNVKLQYSENSITDKLSIFNYPKLEDTSNLSEETLIAGFTWWQGLEETTGTTCIYNLRPGLNTVCIPKTGELLISTDDSTAVVYVGKARIIPKENQLNPQLAFASHDPRVLNNTGIESSLQFKYLSGNTLNSLTVATADVYKYIGELDHDNNFYYTHLPSNFSGLALNDNDPADTLARPKNWFDSQNLVNKFVVSELDSDSFANIGVSKFSKLSRSVLW